VALELSMDLDVDSENVEELVKTTMLSWPLRSCAIIIWSSSKKWLWNCLLESIQPAPRDTGSSFPGSKAAGPWSLTSN
jgi:hypothetical protein